MTPKPGTQRKGLLRLHEVANAVKRLFTRGHEEAQEVTSARSAPSQRSMQQRASQPSPPSPQRSRNTRIDADVPIDVIEQAYIPHDTSSKASFRSDGRDHQRDQELAYGVADDRWNDEDRFTNKSGDPRIGTHRRTYEPAETRAESRE